jgi:predicted LPLAT superfamily acyltransferase
LKSGPTQYDVFFELLGDDQPAVRRGRAKLLQERIDTYAARLEHHCLRAPFQWFNFYDFWGETDDEQR